MTACDECHTWLPLGHGGPQNIYIYVLPCISYHLKQHYITYDNMLIILYHILGSVVLNDKKYMHGKESCDSILL